ncbi:MAG TPA: class I SAM-dependent methyltransferase [Euryarchaeota archaeon]|nr:putative methyltransferase YcgJ [archaeon BMS3Bbin15]HDL14747.1 class I SAM-dependent methyltransferase [Euryarchaeota archaeon]
MKEKIKAIKHFSSRAGKYSGGCFSDTSHLDILIKMAEVKPWFKALDIACGRGFLLKRLSKRVEFAAGIDIAPGMLIDSFKNSVLGDAESLPFRSSSFNVVFTRFAFHHFPEPERVLREISEVLLKGGSFILADGVSSEKQKYSNYLNRLEKLRDPSHIRLYRESELIKILKEGFDTIKVEHYPLKQSLREWLNRASCSADTKEELRKLMEDESIQSN